MPSVDHLRNVKSPICAGTRGAPVASRTSIARRARPAAYADLPVSSRASSSPCQKSTARTRPPTARTRRTMEPNRFSAESGWAASRCHLAISVAPAAQGMNATGTASRRISRVATSGQTEPAASTSLLTRSTCPAAPSVGSTSRPQR